MGTNEVDWKLYTDANTYKPSDVDSSNYNCIYFTGGHGVVFDFVDNKEIQEIAKNIYEKEEIVSGICHGFNYIF
jgi:putative intracellular protease/amidase